MTKYYFTKAFGGLDIEMSLFNFEKDIRCALYKSRKTNYRYIGLDTNIIEDQDVMFVEVINDYVLIDILFGRISLVDAISKFNYSTLFLSKNKDQQVAVETLYTNPLYIPKDELPDEDLKIDIPFITGGIAREACNSGYNEGYKRGNVDGKDTMWCLAEKLFHKYDLEDKLEILDMTKCEAVGVLELSEADVEEEGVLEAGVNKLLFDMTGSNLFDKVKKYEKTKAEEDSKYGGKSWIKYVLKGNNVTVRELNRYSCCKCGFTLDISPIEIESYRHCPRCGSEKACVVKEGKIVHKFY